MQSKSYTASPLIHHDVPPPTSVHETTAAGDATKPAGAAQDGHVRSRVYNLIRSPLFLVAVIWMVMAILLAIEIAAVK